MTMMTLAPQTICLDRDWTPPGVPTHSQTVHIGKIIPSCRSYNKAILIDEERMVVYILHHEGFPVILKYPFSKRLEGRSYWGEDYIYQRTCTIHPSSIRYKEDYRSWRSNVRIKRTRDNYYYTNTFKISREVVVSCQEVVAEMEALYPGRVTY